MAKKNNLDNFFREKLSGYETPERKGNWQLLNHLLEERERRRRMAWRIFFGSLFLVFLFVGYMIFIPGNKENKSVAVSSKNPGSATPAASVTKPAQNESSSNATTSAIENNTTAKASAGNSSENENKNVTVTPKNIAEAVPDNNQKATEKSTTAKQRKNIVQVTKRKKEKAAVAANKNKEHSTPANVDLNLSKKEDVTSPNVNIKAGEEKITTPEAAVNNISAEAKDSAVANQPVAEASVPDSVVNAPADTLPKVAIKDSSKTKNNNSNVAFLNIHAGLNLYRTQSQTLSDERHISPLVGIELMYPLSQRFSAGVGAVYSLQAGYHLSDTSTQVTYFLEKNVSQQVILIRKQHRLYVPLTLYYNLSDKHTVSCGVQWSYLVNTVGDYTESQTTLGTTTQSKKDNVKGYMDGIKSSAVSLSVGYRYSLSKRFDISVRAVQDLSDSYIPQYFYGVNIDPSWSLQTFVSVKF
jgi:hypothetical protein